ncbi:MAG: PEP-CTERM sorting domain-containing protein [Gemmatimonas sp.]
MAAVTGSLMLATSVGAQVVTPANPQGWAEYTYGVPGASAQISGAYARSGNGSVRIQLADNLNSEADWGLTFGGGASYSLSSLSALSYDWYRSSASTTSTLLAPAFAIGTTDGEYLVYEYAYNHVGDPPADTWTTENLLTGNFWFTGNGAGACDRYGAFTTLAAFNTACYGGQGAFNSVTMFMGYSIAGTFDGAVDNVVMTVTGGPSFDYNFELSQQSVVPEPSTYALMAAGLLGVFAARRRRRV